MSLKRNSTSFPKQNYEFIKSLKLDKTDPLRYHQRIVYEFVLKTPWVRGLLVYHKMGAGKSVLGNSICEGLLEQDHDRKIIFMASKSLHNNFRDSISQYRKMLAESKGATFSQEETTEHINARYQFISLNASNMLTQVHRAVKKEAELDTFDELAQDDAEELSKLDQIGDLEHSVLVVDEAHNLFNSISNGSKNAAGLYQLIMKARDIKVIFLTGSPIVNDPFELAIAMNMIAGPFKGGYTLFGEDYMDFSKYFVSVDTSPIAGPDAGKKDDADDVSATIKHVSLNHRDKFVNRIVGLVSYYGADDLAQKKLYPEQLPIIIERVPMSGRQYAAYITARDREIEETQRGSKFSIQRQPLQKPQGMSSSYRVRSRQLSNFLFPDYASKTWKNAKGYLLYEKYIDKINDENLRDLGSKGMGDETKFGLEIWSPKILKMLHNIQHHCPFTFISSFISKEKNVKKGGDFSPEVRPIEDKDWKKIEKLHYKYGDKDTKFEQHSQSKMSGFVAINNNKIIGYVKIEPDGYMRILVTPPNRRRGVATMLITLAMEKCKYLTVKVKKEYINDGRYLQYLKHGFKVLKDEPHFIILERTEDSLKDVIGSSENTTQNSIEIMVKNDIPDAIELYKKIYGKHPEVDFTDADVKVYLYYDVSSKKNVDTKNPVGLAIIKPGYASINKPRGNTNYIVDIGYLNENQPEKQKAMKALVGRILKDHPKLYLKLDRSIPESGFMKTFYEEQKFYVYRESDGFWYLRHIMGSKEKNVNDEKNAPKSKAGHGPGLIYSQFIDSGVNLVGRALKAHGFIEIKDINDALKHKKGAAFAVISGQVDTEVRSEIIKIFNSEENRYGEHLAILLVTSTGAEGLDLKNIRHIHVLEPYWHWARIAQVLARGVRMGSHLALPEKDRNVQPYIYLSDYPPADVVDKMKDVEHIRKQMAKEDTTDVTLYKKSINNQKLIDAFLIATQEASIDCPIHYGPDSNTAKGDQKDCRMCAPTDEPLFIEDLDKDIKTPSRCQPLKEKTMKAKSVTVQVGDKEKEFMYSVDDGKAVHIFEFQSDVGAYAEIYENHPLFDELEIAIKKKEKLK